MIPFNPYDLPSSNSTSTPPFSARNFISLDTNIFERSPSLDFPSILFPRFIEYPSDDLSLPVAGCVEKTTGPKFIPIPRSRGRRDWLILFLLYGLISQRSLRPKAKRIAFRASRRYEASAFLSASTVERSISPPECKIKQISSPCIVASISSTVYASLGKRISRALTQPSWNSPINRS